MTIELPGNIEEQLRNLAAKQGRDVRTIVEEAVHQYLVTLAITDLDATQVAETQAATEKHFGGQMTDGSRNQRDYDSAKVFENSISGQDNDGSATHG